VKEMANDELPEGWVKAPIGQLIEINPKTDLKDTDEVGFVPMSLIGTGFLEAVRYETKLWKEVRKGYTHFQDGDVLLAKITPCFENGKGALVSGLPNGAGAGSTEYFVCRPKKGMLEAKYLHAFFKTPIFMAEAETQMSGSVGHKRVPKEQIVATDLPLAPLAEQKRIADKLVAVLGRVDACRARLDRVPDLLKRFRQSVLAAATSGQLTEDWREENLPTETAPDYLKRICALRQKTWASKQRDGSSRKYPEPDEMVQAELPPVPDSWIWASADALSAQVTDGEHIQPPYQDHGFPMLSAKHIRDGFVDPEGAGLISEEAFTKALARCRPENGDLTIVSVGATTGRTAIVENCPPFAIVRSVLLVKPLISSRYLLRWFQSPWCFKNMTAASGSSAQAHLYIKDTKRLSVPLPPPDEQAEIVRRVEALFAMADRIEARLTAARTQVERLTPATLSKAFRGDLVPQDPNDEPASKLLERLQGTLARKPRKDLSK